MEQQIRTQHPAPRPGLPGYAFMPVRNQRTGSLPGRSSRAGNLSSVTPLLLLVAAIAAAVITAGCALPPHTITLDEVIDRELGQNPSPAYGYRCTVGAHRGASTAFRENTLAALQAADRDRKYAFVEFDVQYTKDRRIVVYHDLRLLRLFGSFRSVGDSTYAELAEMTGGEIATYEDVMDMLTKKINIEIKSQGDFNEDARLADAIIDDIRQRKRDRDVLISSISADLVRYINDTYPGIATGQVYWLTSSTYLHFDRLTEGLFEEFGATRADYLMLHVANLRNIEDLLKLKPRGKAIIFWDFDDKMYLVHKDASDRLWGESGLKALFRSLRSSFLSSFQGPRADLPPPAEKD